MYKTDIVIVCRVYSNCLDSFSPSLHMYQPNNSRVQASDARDSDNRRETPGRAGEGRAAAQLL